MNRDDSEVELTPCDLAFPPAPQVNVGMNDQLWMILPNSGDEVSKPSQRPQLFSARRDTRWSRSFRSPR